VGHARAVDRLFASDELTGEVLGVVYADPATGFGVVELEKLGEGSAARCSGPLADLVEGQTVRLVGEWRDHARYGPTFHATYYEQTVPATVAGLRVFLLSERFPGLSPDVVEHLIDTFGDGTGQVIQSGPRRLVDEAGLSQEAAEELHARWVEGHALAELVRLLEPARVPYDVVRAVHARFGAASVTALTEDPYAMLEADRTQFSHADRLASHLGVEPTDPRRLRAGARAAVAAAARQDGHQYLTRAQCVDAASRLLRVEAVAAAAGVDRAVADGTLGQDTVDALDAVDGPVTAVYTAPGLRAERGLAEQLARLLTCDRSRLAAFADRVSPSDELTTGQAESVGRVFAHPVSVLTGGPGTGKTRTVQEIVAAAEGAGLEVALCAPTGRAAKRIEELVKRPASTIHKLLEARRVPGEGFVFRYGRGERLPHDLVIADEVSMCDTSLAYRLVSAVDTGSHLVLVGDPDQLPPVGPGDVLRDILRSGTVPSVRLTEVHRQAAESRIVTLAYEIDRGEVPVLAGNEGDVFLAETTHRGVVARVVEAVANRAPEYFGVDVADVQVIAPVYRGEAGVDALNAALKAALNPADGQPTVAGFQVGDRVMQTRNDTELDVSNGDVGHVVDVSTGKRSMRVGFPRGEVTYDTAAARDLTLAWAVTVHKSQGGEWPVVVFVCDSSHRGMLWRNLAYTAVTRAQRALVVVGQQAALRAAGEHDRPRNRQTLLAARLRALVPPVTLSTQPAIDGSELDSDGSELDSDGGIA